MSNDRELLELAAKAAGIELYWNIPERSNTPWRMSGVGDDRGPADIWNPLIDDGDALRLAVQLELHIHFYRKHVDVNADVRLQSDFTIFREDFTTDTGADTRRAIVRAAAEIGKAMP